MRRLLLIGGVAAVAMVVAELAVHVLAPYLPEPLLYTDETTQVKVAQMEEIADDEGCVDVAFAGSSMMRDAVDPEVFTGADPDGRTGYNAALDAATPVLLEEWIPEEVVPRLDAQTVVVGITSFDLNDNVRVGGDALDSYGDATLLRDDLMGRMQRPFVRHVDLFRYRNELRNPQVLWDSLGRLRRGDREPRLGPAGIEGLIGPRGEGLSRRDLTWTGSPALLRFVQAELLNDYETGGAQTRAARDLLTELVEDDRSVVLVALPVTADYVAQHPGGRADFDRFLTAAGDLAQESGAGFVDLHDWTTDETLFADTHHLNADGAEALSGELPGLLADDLGGSC